MQDLEIRYTEQIAITVCYCRTSVFQMYNEKNNDDEFYSKSQNIRVLLYTIVFVPSNVHNTVDTEDI